MATAATKTVKKKPSAKAKPAAPAKLTKPTAPSAKAAPAQLMVIELAKIKKSGTNPRQFFDETALNELADSIRTLGLAQPLLVRPDGAGVTLVAGERRWRAARIAGLKSVPCYVREMSEQEALELQIIENLQRQDVTAFEEAQGYQRLVANGHTAHEIAARIGKSVRYVWQSLNLARLPEQAIEDLRAGTLTKSVALEIATLPNDQLRKKAVQDFRDYQGNYPTVEKLRTYIEREFRKELKGAPFDLNSPTLLPSAGDCQHCPKRTGNARDIYPDGRADICTDTACFDAKVKAARAASISILKQQGHTIIVGKQADKLISYDGKKLNYQAEKDWVLADAKCDHDPKQHWRKKLGKELKPTILEDSKGNRLEIYSRAEAEQVLIKKYPALKIDQPESEHERETPANREQQRKLQRQVFNLALQQIQLRAEELSLESILRAGFNDLMLALGGDQYVYSVVRRGEEAVTDSQVATYLEGLSTKEFTSLVACGRAFDVLDGWARFRSLDELPDDDDYMQLFNLDWPALIKQAEADVAAAQQAVADQEAAIVAVVADILDDLEAA